MFDRYLDYECKTLAECFVLSGKDGWDTEDFVHKLFHTEWGLNILRGVSIHEYACEEFMYEGLLMYNKKVVGDVYQENILRYCGYLYRYLVATSKCTSAKIYNKASLYLIASRYDFYHAQDWDYVRRELGL